MSMTKEDVNTQKNLHVELRIKPPPKYKIIFYNDQYTTMDFVVNILKRVFAKSAADAEALTWKIHQEGNATIGLYRKEIAETMIFKVRTMAEDKGYPLRVEMEKE